MGTTSSSWVTAWLGVADGLGTAPVSASAGVETKCSAARDATTAIERGRLGKGMRWGQARGGKVPDPSRLSCTAPTRRSSALRLDDRAAVWGHRAELVEHISRDLALVDHLAE